MEEQNINMDASNSQTFQKVFSLHWEEINISELIFTQLKDGNCNLWKISRSVSSWNWSYMLQTAPNKQLS
jgi:hypothetical protein